MAKVASSVARPRKCYNHRRVGKPNFLSNFSQLLLFNMSLFTVLFTAKDFLFVYAAFWLGICVEVDVDMITGPNLHYQLS